MEVATSSAPAGVDGRAAPTLRPQHRHRIIYSATQSIRIIYFISAGQPCCPHFRFYYYWYFGAFIFFFSLSFLKCTPENLGVRSPQLTDDAAAGLERGEVIVFEVQCLVVGNVLGGQHLAAGGAGGVVQFGGAGVRFPGGFLALLGFVGSLLLF